MKQEETPEETYERVYREALLNNTKPLKLWEICEIYHKERKDKEIAELKENMQNISKGLIVEHHINIEKDREISALKEEVERLKGSQTVARIGSIGGSTLIPSIEKALLKFSKKKE